MKRYKGNIQGLEEGRVKSYSNCFSYQHFLTCILIVVAMKANSSFCPWPKPSLRSCTWCFQYLLNCIGLCLNVYCHHCPCLRHQKLYLGVSLKERKIGGKNCINNPSLFCFFIKADSHLLVAQLTFGSTITCSFGTVVSHLAVYFIFNRLEWFLLPVFVTSFYAFGHSGEWDRTCL